MRKGIDYPGISIVFYCHDGNGKFLMGKRSANCRDEHGCWDIGSGGLEFGDSVEDTLKIEIFQEYCTKVLEYEFLGYRDVHRKNRDVETHWVGLDFKVFVDFNKWGNGEPHKFDEVKWFDKDSLPSPVHSQFPEFLRKYKDRL